MSADDSIATAERDADRTVLELLLHSQQWPWSIEEVGRELGDLPRAEDALSRLSGAGLVHRHARFAFPTRAAIRAVELDLAGR
jgi:hypothetical protein